MLTKEVVLIMAQVSLIEAIYNVHLTCDRKPNIWGCPRGVMVKVMDSVLQSRYYVHFRANTLGKGMNPLIPPAMG